MKHLPLFARLEGRDCLVVGGGGVAERRVAQLLGAGARVTVVAPRLTNGLRRLRDDHRIRHVDTEFSAGQLEDCWLVVAATDDRNVNETVSLAAEAAKRLCNVVDEPALCSFIMPAIIDRDPITIAIGSGGHAPVLSRWLKGVIESRLPARIGALASLMGQWRTRVRQALPDIRRRRLFWEQLLESPVAEACYAGRDAQAGDALAARLEAARASEPAATPGEAYLVGAGPGSPDLMTLRGRQLLSQADVVLYDRLINTELLAFARRDAELILVGKSPRQPSITQQQLNRLLVRLVANGQRVCRLKGGDPMIFGRGGEELDALAEAGLRFQVVPGISAVEGCAAYAGIPLTMRGLARTVLLATGHTVGDGRSDLAAFQPGQTLALYMGVARYAEVSAELIRLGHDPQTAAAVVEKGTTDAQRVIRTTLRRLSEAAEALSIEPPALLLIGETTRFAERFGWFAPERLEIFDDDGTRPRKRPLARVS